MRACSVGSHYFSLARCALLLDAGKVAVGDLKVLARLKGWGLKLTITNQLRLRNIYICEEQI